MSSRVPIQGASFLKELVLSFRICGGRALLIVGALNNPPSKVPTIAKRNLGTRSPKYARNQGCSIEEQPSRQG